MKQKASGEIDFKLYYEDLEEKKVKKTSTTNSTIKKTKPAASKKTQKTGKTPKSRLLDAKKFVVLKYTVVKLKLEDVVNKALHPSKTAKKMTKMEQKAVIQQRKNVIMGIGLLFVIVSITYSTYIVRTFVNTGGSLIALAPQVVFAGYILLKAFSKLYK
jgi:hypothetical protein